MDIQIKNLLDNNVNDIKEISNILNISIDLVETLLIEYGKKYNTYSEEKCSICFDQFDFNKNGKIPTQLPCCQKYMCVHCTLKQIQNLNIICPFCKNIISVNQRLYDQWLKYA
jgi:hypothetical protein